MTPEELNLKIAEEKLDAWEFMYELARATPQDLIHMGRRGLTPAEALLQCFKETNLKIEKMIKRWEAENPD